ncbi:MAG: T9SS type A sorting domain-containing protein [Sporocytophaga sp.]|uniref:T9SS type A sorting domain-containing protein n=1 Tax=Sporocytophaga sp. TaxID=2231183 RepID=UPI001B0336A9|nr:T9SS type A sorting domain-containing protein [Sporocytophaga sp.]MBO9702908.1 T9SS type A sorting domain-containing protein [Sporocytophaga sp.]
MKKQLLLSLLISASSTSVSSFVKAEVIKSSAKHNLKANEILITKQPEDVAVCVGTGALFYIQAEGENLSYQWQVYTGFAYVDINGAESDSYLSPPVETEMNGSLYRCVITDGSETKIYSESGKLTVSVNPTIISDPESVSLWENGTAVFEVAATGGGLSYAWFTDRGAGPEYIEGANSSKLTLNKVGTDLRGQSYTCDVISSCGTITSASAELSVHQASLCMASYDKSSGKNVIVIALDKSENYPVIDSFRVYRDGLQIGRMVGSDYSVFIDNSSHPESESYSYSIAVRGFDGNVTPLAQAHKTVLLSQDEQESAITINWNAYEGAGITEYAIYRGTAKDALELVTTVSDGIYSFTDLNPPVAEKLFYQIEMHWVSCFPSARTSEDVDLSSNLLEVENVITSLQKLAAGKINVYPNPAREYISVEGLQAGDAVSIMDLSGRVVKLLDGSQNTLSLSGLEDGMYILEVNNQAGRRSVPIIVK